MTDIFISYGFTDIEWVKRIQKHLAPLLKKKHLSLWSDNLIYLNKNLQESIQLAIKEAQVIIVLISSNYLDSKLPEVELSLVIDKYRNDTGKVFPVIVSPISILSISDIPQEWQTIGSISKPLSSLSEKKQEEALRKLTQFIDNSISTRKQIQNDSNVVKVINLGNMWNLTTNIFIEGANELQKQHNR
ncbi:MAG: toll/interleukin-1 receptor domain-containing protein [Crocosphaera sp.]|nr:toll/interleukin-1 receptor domain-containing protein [Crocosphaera sp.]